MFTAPTAFATSAIMILSGSAIAAYDNAMYESTDPSSYGTLIASLDIASTAYDFPTSGGFTSSGYINEVAGFEFDRTELVTEVYSVNSPQSFNTGGDTINLIPGDRVYAYRLRLVEASTNTINALREFQVTGLNLIPGSDALAGDSLLRGRGYYLSGGAVNTPDAGAGDYNDLGALGGTLDWRFDGADTDQLDNDQEITFLVFAKNSPIGNGFSNLAAQPGQEAGVDPNANNAPVLIPIVPAPASAILTVFAGIGLTHRRRTR